MRKLLGAVSVVVLLPLAVVIANAPWAGAAPQFPECPAAGADTGCALVIQINADGTQTVLSDPNQPPYGSPSDTEDTLIGVLNNSSATIPSLVLTGTPGTFGFDGDGLCTFTPMPNGCQNGKFASNQVDTTGYGGPDNHFTDINSDQSRGTVVFDNGGLQPGAGDFFALDNALSASQLTPPNPTPSPTSNPCQQSGPIKRISGTDRIGTAIAASNCIGTAGAHAVVLARSDIFPDSLAGTPLAVAVGAPLLLTPPDSLDPRVSNEIQRVLPQGSTVFLLGGTSALTPQVEQSVRDLGYATVRYGAQNRFGTAVQIAHFGLADPQNLFLATGFQFPDALSASSAATQAKGAVLLTADNVMPPETAAYLNSRANATVYAVGGQATAADPNARSVSGTNRYQTSAAVADTFFPSPTGFGLASGANFPDALAGGAQVGAMGQPLLISDPANLSPEIQSYLNAHQSSIAGGQIYGGQSAISDNVEQQAAVAIGQG